jgi:geranylgeranyl diphosphate synthase type I
VGVPADKTLEAVWVLDEASLDLCEGQYLDLSFEGMAEVSTAAYLDMISKKTAALFAAAARIGALLGTDAEEKISGLGSFGERLGMAFQIQDDILGTWGKEEATGKPSLSDIRSRKKSLPVVHALTTARGQELESLQRIFRQTEVGPEDAATVLAILERLGSRDYCEGLAQSYYEEALAQLDALSLEEGAATALRELAAELVSREA